MGRPLVKIGLDTLDTVARVKYILKQVLQEMNQEDPKRNYQGEPIPTATQRWGPLVAWVIYCSGSGAENEHLELLGLPPENGHERAYILTPQKALGIVFHEDEEFLTYRESRRGGELEGHIDSDRHGLDIIYPRPGVEHLLDFIVDLLPHHVPEGTSLSRSRIAFNWCREDPRHDTIGYATLDYLRRAIVQRYDSGLVVVEGPPDPKDPHYETKPTHPIKEDAHPDLWKPFYGSAEFHWEQRFPSAYPIIKRLEEHIRAAVEQP